MTFPLAPLTPPSDEPTFERMGEYAALLQNTAAMSARRQNSNTLFITLNTVFLTGIGIFLYMADLRQWWPFFTVAIITVAIIAVILLPLNIIWFVATRRYVNEATYFYDYLREIEDEFRRRRNDDRYPQIGGFRRATDDIIRGTRHVDFAIPVYFLILYHLMAAALAGVISAIQQGIIPPR
jgi:hypothetical protein